MRTIATLQLYIVMSPSVSMLRIAHLISSPSLKSNIEVPDKLPYSSETLVIT